MELMEAITQRRSIRKYTSDPVPEEALRTLLEAARWAPSWANTQTSEFIIVRDSAIKKKLAETLPEKNPARDACMHAPVIIAACGQKGKAGFFKGAPVTDKGDWLMFDLALALQNLTLAAHALGLGTVHVGFFDSKQAEEVLGVPPATPVVDLLPLGFPDGEAKAASRRGLDVFVFYDRYGNK